MTDKQLRLLLYLRQCQILHLQQGHESVALPGSLVRLNPNLLK
jgi:hypothetical protein